MNRTRTWLSALVLLSHAACASQEGAGQIGNGGTAGAGDPPLAGASGTGAAIAHGDAQADVEEPDACAASVEEAYLAPLDVLFLVDNSLSMGGGKWPAVTGAVKAFLNDSSSQAIGAGIQYFPLTKPGMTALCYSDADCSSPPCFAGQCLDAIVCDLATYSDLAVPVAPISSNREAIIASMDSKAGLTPGLTPMAPALEGVIDLAKSWSSSHPERTVVVVLATDGWPNMCTGAEASILGVSKVASAGFAAQISTFVIGLGSDLADLNAIASAGGTGQAFLVDQGDISSAFHSALQAIRDVKLGCEYSVPTSSSPELDYANVNVRVTDETGPQVVPRADNEAACGSGDGWYYGDQTKTKIVLCPASCERVQGKQEARVELLVGCKTVVK
jgi:Mg-chelatase subunit ChlD